MLEKAHALCGAEFGFVSHFSMVTYSIGSHGAACRNPDRSGCKPCHRDLHGHTRPCLRARSWFRSLILQMVAYRHRGARRLADDCGAARYLGGAAERLTPCWDAVVIYRLKSARSLTSRSHCWRISRHRRWSRWRMLRLITERRDRTGDLQESLEYQTATSRCVEGHQPVGVRSGAGVGGDGCGSCCAAVRKRNGVHPTAGGGGYRIAASVATNPEAMR